MKSNLQTNILRIRKMTIISMFCALAYLSVFIFRIEVAGFLTFEVKDAVITIASMFFGPVYGITIALIASFLEFITISGTGIYGLIINFISSAVFAGVAGLIYKHKKNLFGAIISLSSSVVATTTIMILANLLLTPHYFGIEIAQVVSMIPKILLPFNILKTTLNMALVLMFYKSVSNVLRHIFAEQNDISTVKSSRTKNIIVLLAGILIAVTCIVIFIFVFNGTISFFKLKQ